MIKPFDNLFFTPENHLITDNEIICFAKLVEVVAINLDSLIYVCHKKSFKHLTFKIFYVRDFLGG